MKKLNRFYFDQNISIDNALTTNQIIHQIINQIDKIVDELNAFETDAHDYTDNKIIELRAELLLKLLEDKEELTEQITELQDYVNREVSRVLNESKSYTDDEIVNFKDGYLHQKITEIYETISRLSDRLDNRIDFIDAKFEKLIEDTKDYLVELIKHGGAVYSSVDGDLVSAEKNLKDLTYKLQLKNGVTWTNILNRMLTQIYPEDMYEVQNASSYTGGDFTGIYVVKSFFNDLCNPYSANPFVYFSRSSDSNHTYIGLMSSANKSSYRRVVINGDIVPIGAIETLWSGSYTYLQAVIIPMYRKNSNNDYELGYTTSNWSFVPFKRINKIEIVMDIGVFKSYLVIDQNDYPYEDVTYNSIIDSCENNKNYNTWDSLTYYTVQFLENHLKTENYKIPIDTEYEKLGTGNTINQDISFYHNRMEV